MGKTHKYGITKMSLAIVGTLFLKSSEGVAVPMYQYLHELTALYCAAMKHMTNISCYLCAWCLLLSGRKVLLGRITSRVLVEVRKVK